MKTRKILTIVLTAAMIFSLASVSAFAQATINVGNATFTGDNVVFDGANYYTSLTAALEGIHLTDKNILYCKPEANLGTMTHGHVCKSLTVYGNGAYISGGEQEFEIDTYKYCHNGANTCEGLTGDITLIIDNLTGAGAWGQRNTAHTINVVFTNCTSMSRIYFSGTSGVNNLSLTDCTFTSNTGGECKVYSNANGKVKVSGCSFSNLDEAINLNHKIAGTQIVEIENCSFNSVGDANVDYAAPVRVLSSVEGAASTVTVKNCTFTGTVANSIGQNADILLDYGVGTTTANISATAANVGVEKENNTATYKTVTASETVTLANAEAASPIAKIGDVEYETFQKALNAVESNQTIELLAGEISEGRVMFPSTLTNVTIKGADNKSTVLKDMTIQSADGNSTVYEGITIEGIVFENSKIVMTGWRTGTVSYKDWTITNCEFNDVVDTANNAAIHFNLAETEAIKNFTFTNNVINGVSGSSNSGVYAQLTGDVLFENNVINNVAFRPYIVQLTSDDGIADEFVVKGNTFSGSASGRAQALTNNSEGTDAITLVVSENIFKDITNSQQICYWNFNAEKTTATLSDNYYDIDLTQNTNRIYFNEAASSVEDLVSMGVYPLYTELNEDGTIDETSIVVADDVLKTNVAKIGDVEYTDLQTAIDAAKNEDTIVLLADMTFESDIADAGKGYFNIPDGKVIDIDLNEKTINVTENSTGNFILFYNYGELTIKNGTINLTAIQNRGWNAESAIVLNRGGLLNVESGTFTHLGGTDMAFVVDNSGNWFGETTANIVGGTLTSSYIAIRNRMEQNERGYSGTAYLNIAGGTINGNSRAVWAQAASVSEKSPATGVINVTGGSVGMIDTARSSGAVCVTTLSGGVVDAFKVEKGELKITGGTVTGTLTILDASGNTVESDEIISGGTFSSDVSAYLADGYTLTANSDGTYSVESITIKTLPTINLLIQNMPTGTMTGANGETITTYRAGCFAAIDSTAYSVLGIEVRADGGKVTGKPTTEYLYTYITVTNNGVDTPFYPKDFGETNKYIFGRIIETPTNYTDFCFRPFAVSLDGKTTFYGEWSKEYTVDPQE